LWLHCWQKIKKRRISQKNLLAFLARLRFFLEFYDIIGIFPAILIMAFRSLRGFSGQLLLEPELPKKYPNLFFHPKVY
jgi:hypothetical protein